MWKLLCIIDAENREAIGGTSDTEEKINDMAAELRRRYPLSDIKIFGPADAAPVPDLD